MNPKVSIVVLNYNNAKDTIKCIMDLRNINYDNYEVIVVDNNSSDGSCTEIESEIKNEILIKSEVNGGYAKGNNLGIIYGLDHKSDYFCILNNDVIVENDFLLKLVTFLENNRDTAFVGPKICDFENKEIIQSAGSEINMNYGRAKELYKGYKVNDVHENIINCDYVSGSCILTSRRIIEKIGLIPDEYFLFYEENEWCLNARKSNFKVFCDFKATIWHKGSHTINKISGLSEYFMYRNVVIFINRNGTLLNKIIFNLYFSLFCLKSLITKKNGKRFFRYYCDGLKGTNKYESLQK